MNALFDAYLIVDWSASSRPKRGTDSIWYCLLEPGQEPDTQNPATRHEAIEKVEAILVRLVDEKKSVLVGFDFPYACPAGVARALGLDTAGQKPWRAVWREWGSLIKDQPDNGNNRFEVAAQLNERLSSGPGPFWGCPSRRVGTCLTARKPRPWKLHEWRLAEQWVRQQTGRPPQSVWKLLYRGSVGSQALVGIKHLKRLRDHPTVGPVSRVWPFEWDAEVKEALQHRRLLVLHAEIYPSLVTVNTAPGEVKDQAQVRDLANYFRCRDEAGELTRLLDVPLALPEGERSRVCMEEGWILGTQRALDPASLRT